METMPMFFWLQVCGASLIRRWLIGERTGAKKEAIEHTTAHANGASAMAFFRYCLNCKLWSRANDLLNQNIVTWKNLCEDYVVV